jgi:hypothetical protein
MKAKLELRRCLLLGCMFVGSAFIANAALDALCIWSAHSDPVPSALPVTRTNWTSEQLDRDVRATLAVQPDAVHSDSALRLDAHHTAANALARMSFYGDGVGMFATPSITNFYFGVGTELGWKGTLIRRVSRRLIGLYSGTNTATGFLDRHHEGVRIVVTGCATCHFGRVLGRDVPGLGNKNIDPFALGRWIEDSDAVLSRLPVGPRRSEESDRLQDRSLAMAARLQHGQASNQTQGMVPVSLVIRWFYQQAGVHFPDSATPGCAKVPALWGYSEKVKVGLFCDGMGDGHHSAWGAAVELAAGNSAENVRQQLKEIVQAEEMLGNLLPPAYPLRINWDQAAAGQRVFELHCASCHGQYRKNELGLPLFEPPVRVAIDEIGTDCDRLNIVTDEALDLMTRSPLHDVIRSNPTYRKGYFAPRLEGIWSRFPYLHNGSVPNMAALLTVPSERPDLFDLIDAGEAYRFDEESLGLTVPHRTSPDYRTLQGRAQRKERDVYDTSRLGHSNRGHDYGTQLPAAAKRALIEYLKAI